MALPLKKDVCEKTDVTKQLEKKQTLLLAALHRSLSSVAKHQGDLDTAIKEVKMAISIEPDNYLGHYQMGHLYEIKRDLDGMEIAVCRATQLCPTDAESWNGLGNAFRDKGNLKEASQAYRKAQQLGMCCKDGK